MSLRRRIRTAGLAIVAAAAILLGTSGLQSAAQQVPGSRQPGTVTPGATAVFIANQPTVQAQQAGEWRVSVPDGISLRDGVAFTFDGPAFLQVGHRYTIRWGSGVEGRYTIERLSKGWALARTPSSRLWINTAQAATIEEN